MSYYVSSYGGWFVVNTTSKRKAHSEGVAEFGRGMVKTVRRATQADIDYFVSQKGKNAVNPTL